MFRASFHKSVFCWACWMSAVALLQAMASGQTVTTVVPPAPNENKDAAPMKPSAVSTGSGLAEAPGAAEVTADDVYIRSGPSANHYTVLKVAKGAHLQIVNESGEWYEIVPPEGAFSLISGDYVDAANEKAGVVNGNNVRVRTGSTLNDNKYTVQTLLSKGTEVTILGRNPDGFLRIAPPAGATLWINRAYLRRLNETAFAPIARNAPSQEPLTPSVKPDGAEAKASAQSKPHEPDRPTRSAEAKLAGDSSSQGSTALEQMRELQSIDSAVRSELDKPVLQRKLQPFYQRYRAVEDSPADEVSRKYAKVRADQLQGMMSVLDTVGNVQGLNETAEQKRRRFLEERAGMATPAPATPDQLLDAQGELRLSALYPKGGTPRRFRLVDPSGPNDRTVGYVEIPEGLSIDIDKYLGAYVGVRAAIKRWQDGGVDPVPIFILGELMLTERPAHAAGKAGH